MEDKPDILYEKLRQEMKLNSYFIISCIFLGQTMLGIAFENVLYMVGTIIISIMALIALYGKRNQIKNGKYK